MKFDFEKMVQNVSEEGSRRTYLRLIETMIKGFCAVTNCGECPFKLLMEFGNGKNACLNDIIDFAIKKYNIRKDMEE